MYPNWVSVPVPRDANGGVSISQLPKQPVNQSISQSVNQSINQWRNRFKIASQPARHWVLSARIGLRSISSSSASASDWWPLRLYWRTGWLTNWLTRWRCACEEATGARPVASHHITPATSADQSDWLDPAAGWARIPEWDPCEHTHEYHTENKSQIRCACAPEGSKAWWQAQALWDNYTW